MRPTIYTIGKKYIEKNELKTSILSVAKELNLEVNQSEPEHIDLYIPSGDYLEIWFSEKETFSKGIKADSSLPGYGYILAIDYLVEDRTLIPFLKGLLNMYPDMLVYNIDASDSGRLTFDKAQIDAFDTLDSYIALHTPPSD